MDGDEQQMHYLRSVRLARRLAVTRENFVWREGRRGAAAAPGHTQLESGVRALAC